MNEVFDITAAVKRLTELEQQAKTLRNKIKDYRKNGSYGQYLKSDHWKALRALHCGAGAKCCACGFDGDLQLHHLTYDRLWAEATGDLIVICIRCHHKLHMHLISKYPGKSTSRLVKQTKKDWKRIFGV